MVILCTSGTRRYRGLQKCRSYEISHLNRGLWLLTFIFISMQYPQTDEEVELPYLLMWISKSLPDIRYRVISPFNFRIVSVSFLLIHMHIFTCVNIELNRTTCRLNVRCMLKPSCITDIIPVTSSKSWLLYKINKHTAETNAGYFVNLMFIEEANTVWAQVVFFPRRSSAHIWLSAHFLYHFSGLLQSMDFVAAMSLLFLEYQGEEAKLMSTYSGC